jgi:hypothetical protein
MLHLSRLDTRGVSRSSRNVRRDAVDVKGPTDERLSLRTAKSCGPGVKGFSSSISRGNLRRVSLGLNRPDFHRCSACCTRTQGEFWRALTAGLKGFIHLHVGLRPNWVLAERFALIESDSRCWGPNGVVRMGVAGWRFARLKRTLTRRAAVVAVLEELPFICPVVVAVGSLIMIGIMLCRDWP